MTPKQLALLAVVKMWTRFTIVVGYLGTVIYLMDHYQKYTGVAMVLFALFISFSAMVYHERLDHYEFESNICGGKNSRMIKPSNEHRTDDAKDHSGPGATDRSSK